MATCDSLETGTAFSARSHVERLLLIDDCHGGRYGSHVVNDSQSLEFIAEPRILAEMKIENRGKIHFPWKKISKHTFFSMKIKMVDL